MFSFEEHNGKHILDILVHVHVLYMYTRIKEQRSPGVAHFGGTLVARWTDGARALVGLTVRAVWTLDGDVISGDRTIPVNQVTVLVASKSQ